MREWTNRDHVHGGILTLDSLTAHEAATYRSGLWLGPPVRSADLPGVGKHGRDPEAVAELVARIEVQLERTEYL